MLTLAGKIALLLLNLSLGVSLFRTLSFMVHSKWEVHQPFSRWVDGLSLLISGIAVSLLRQSWAFTQVVDWLLLLVLVLFGIEKFLWRYPDAKRNSLFFLLLVLVALLFLVELGMGSHHIAEIDPLILVYSSLLCGMSISLLVVSEIPSAARQYLFYAVFFRGYLYAMKLIISWYAGFPGEIVWSRGTMFQLNLAFGMLVPFVLFFPGLFKSPVMLKIGLSFILLSAFFEIFVFF